MTTFNEAMLSNDRTLAIRVGDFTSENIKSANFKYGYITGDDFTPGGTYAGTASILFTSIVESFKKLDVIYPEIGLLVGSKVEWVKMGKYYIDNIKIDRNANTTEIELMDEMFKLNESFKTDLKYPAQIRDVILEIATKTGVTLASDDFGTTAIQQHVDEPTGDKLTYRDVLSQASQLLGFSCFFNRNGELEVRGLTESGITITADNYFLHGLEKSEVEYQIAGITCEVANNEKLTVGLQTGRSLEIENPLATQDTLNLLYYALKDIVYYPYDLSYQGHLKLDVGQWVTIKTNKDETLKVPVLYQSFSFSGGLTSTISADSVAGSDVQYTYGSFVTKKIEQKSTQIQAEVQQQLKYADEEFKKVSNEMLQQSLEYQNSVRNELATSKAEIKTQIDTAKMQAETNAKTYADEINQVTAGVAEQANAAANSLKSDLAKVKTDLTATTSTANTTKTNLANYQASNDKAVANLQSNLQTANGNISSLKTKIEAVPGQITSAVSAVEGKIPNVDNKNLLITSTATPNAMLVGSEVYPTPTATTGNSATIKEAIKVSPGEKYTFTKQIFKPGDNYWRVSYLGQNFELISRFPDLSNEFTITIPKNVSYLWISFPMDSNPKVEKGSTSTSYLPAPEDYDSKLIAAQSEIKQTTESIKASVSALDKSTVKSASLTINTDGIVMKAGKSTTDVANAIGSYFAVNQNAINLFSDKINVKGSMIVDGAITSTKIASKSINTAHLNGKIITADVISSNAITANAIKAGAVTTSAMSANSINGDRITAGTLDAAKIKAGSITASQIASGTITSAQIKTGTISAANIAAGAITTNHLATGSITADKIVAGSITADMFKGNKLTSLNGATTLNLQTGEIIFNDLYATISQTRGNYKSQISLFSLNHEASHQSSWASINALAFNSTNLTSATRRVGLSFDMFDDFSRMTLQGEKIAFTSENEKKPNYTNAIIINSNKDEVGRVNSYVKDSKGTWNYSMFLDIGSNAAILTPDIQFYGRAKSLEGILNDLCKKVGIMWI